MKDLHIVVNNKIATYQKRDGDIVCGNNDYQIVFTFDDEWDSYSTKTARFVWNGKYLDVIFAGNTCPVPIIQNADSVEVGVYAGNLCTTTPAKIGCVKSILCKTDTQHPDAVVRTNWGVHHILLALGGDPQTLGDVRITHDTNCTHTGWDLSKPIDPTNGSLHTLHLYEDTNEDYVSDSVLHVKNHTSQGLVTLSWIKSNGEEEEVELEVQDEYSLPLTPDVNQIFIGAF